MIDLKAELQNFRPINLEEIIQVGEKVPDNIRNSIFLYNKAIESLRTGSEDIAVIELKKATSMNPQFNEALNLLGICYSYIGENDKAAEVFNKVIKAESNSVLAMKYMQRLGMVDAVQQQPGKPSKKVSGQTDDIPKRVREARTTKTEKHGTKRMFLSYIMLGAGFAAGLIISAVIFSSYTREVPVPQPDQSAIEDAVSSVKSEYEQEYALLKEKYDMLQKDKDMAIQQADYYKTTLKLYEIDDLYRGKKYTEAADMLLIMKTVEFKDAERQKFESLYEAVMPLAAKSVYDQGYKLYNSKKYQDALKLFERIQVYDPTYGRMDAALYYMGRSSQFLHDSRSAVALFQRLIDNYPKSSYVKSAKVRINELTKIP